MRRQPGCGSRASQQQVADPKIKSTDVIIRADTNQARKNLDNGKIHGRAVLNP